MAGKSRKGAMRHLELKGQTWWFRREIPPACRLLEDDLKAYKVNLQTSDVRMPTVTVTATHAPACITW